MISKLVLNVMDYDSTSMDDRAGTLVFDYNKDLLGGHAEK